MSDQTVRLAFVGAGSHSTESLMPNIAHIPEFDFVAVCDLNADRAAWAARRFGALRHFTDMETMLDDVELDAVCVVGPPSLHHDAALQCLSRRIPVFIEKPPAPDLAQSRALVDAATAADTFCMVGFMKRFAPANVLVREFIDGSEFGALRAISLIHGCGPYNNLYQMMIFNGIHMVDTARFFAGEVEQLSANAVGAGEDQPGVALQMSFRAGHVGTMVIHSGPTWQDATEQVYLGGTNGIATIDGSARAQVRSMDRQFAQGEGLELASWTGGYEVSGNKAGWWPSGHYTRGYWGELSHFAKAVLGQVEPRPTLVDGLENMRIVEAVMISVGAGAEPVRIDDVN